MIGIADFHFIRPLFLLGLFPVTVLAILLWRSKLSQGIWVSICDEALLPYLLQEKSRPSRSLLISGLLATVLAVIAASGPTWQRLPAPAFRNASALVIALDLTGSMDAQDIKPSRLVRARYKIADLLKQRKDGQTALLVYSGAAFTVTPLTDDTQTIESQLSALTTDMMPSTGNDTSAVIGQAVALFKQAGLQKGQIILVTDEVDVEPLSMAINALDSYQVSVLGVGTAEGAPIPETNGGFVKDQQGSIIIPKLNSRDLAEIAQIGHGIYQTITPDDSDIHALLAWSDQAVLSGEQVNSNVVVELWDDKGPWVLLMVLPLLALQFRKGVLMMAFALIIPFPKNSYALDWQRLWQTPDQQAQKAFAQQDFATAAAKFTDPQWQAAAHYKAGSYDKAVKTYEGAPQTGNSDYFYNQGNALARSGQLEQAIKSYDQALVIKPDDIDAKYNREQVAKALAEQQQKDQQKQDNDKHSEQDKTQGEQDKQNQQSDKNDGRPEQKPERSDDQSSSPSQQKQQPSPADQQQEQAKEDAEKQKSAEANPAEKQPENDKKPDKPKEQGQESVTVESEEEKQATEQWLKRIPDDPAGLLKRKFKYQYSQRLQQNAEKP